MKRKRKTIGAMVVIAIAIIVTFNIYQSTSQENKMSVMALANLEALADGEYSDGARIVVATDHGTSYLCINNHLYSVVSYSIDCIGAGNLSCVSGVYKSMSDMGPCYIA